MSLNGPESNESKVDVTEVDKITKEIQNLVETPDPNTESQKDLNRKLTNEVVDQLTSSGEAVKNQLKESILKLFENHSTEEGFFDNNGGVVKLAEALGLKKDEEGNWIDASAEAVDDDIKQPSISWRGELGGIKSGEESEKQSGNKGLYKGLTRDKIEGEIDPNKNLYVTINEIGVQKAAVDDLLKGKLKGNEDLTKISAGLTMVQTVIDYPTRDNVRALQKFISENLPNDSVEKRNFDNASKKGNEFDGYFGDGTLSGVNILLEKIGEFVNEMKGYLDKLILKDDVKIKNEVIVAEGGSVDQKAFIDGELPEGVSITFEPKLEEIKTDVTQDYNVKIKLKKNNEERDIGSVVVKVVNNVDDKPTEPEAPKQEVTQPLNVDGGQHLVMRNSGELATKYNLSGATFYSADVCTLAEGEQSQPQLAESTAENNGETVYFVKFNNSGNIFEIRVDQNGGLCPITTEYDQFVNGIESKVLIKNNGACINYLRNKLGNIPCSIQRNNGVQDYTIRSFGNELTIEPMTIDRKWVSEDLGVCLRLLNFTNFLTSGVDSNLKGTDPNLRLRGDKVQVQTVKGRQDISVDKFGLFPFDDGDMKRFIKYNNHEDWNDNWDRKKPNRIYKKLDISGRAQIIGGSQAVGQAFGSRFSTGSTGVGAVSTDVVPTQADGAPTSNEVRGESLKQEELSLLLVGLKFDDLGTMQESGSGYKIFEFNNVKTEGVKEGENSGNTESGDESSDKSGNKYIEIGGNKFMEATENYTGLGYKVDENWVYIGEFEDGRRNGMGIQTPSNMQGIGEGEFTWSCGDKYIGEWENDQMTKGTYTWTNGDKYEGEWENGKMTGEGTYTWTNGNKYEGKWENGKMTGEGTYTWANNGGKFVGKFEDGKMVSGKFVLSDKEYEIVKVEENSLMRIVDGPSDVGKYIDWNVDDGPKIVDGPTSS